MAADSEAQWFRKQWALTSRVAVKDLRGRVRSAFKERCHTVTSVSFPTEKTLQVSEKGSHVDFPMPLPPMFLFSYLFMCR